MGSTQYGTSTNRFPLKQGRRHPWTMQLGFMTPEVLEWIRGDEALTPGTSVYKGLRLDFKEGSSTKRRLEEQRKALLPGSLGQCSSGAIPPSLMWTTYTFRYLICLGSSRSAVTLEVALYGSDQRSLGARALALCC